MKAWHMSPFSRVIGVFSYPLVTVYKTRYKHQTSVDTT